MKKKRLSILGLLAWLAFALGCSSNSGLDNLDAYISCQQWVKNELSSPESAVFPAYQTAIILEENSAAPDSPDAAGDFVITESMGGRYRIKSFVESKNSSKEIVRFSFLCEVETVAEYGGQGLRLDSLELWE